MDKGKISAQQFALIMYLYIIGTAALVQPHTLVSIAGQDAWFSVIIVGIIQLGLITLYLKLGFRYPQQTIIQYGRLLTGKWFGSAIAVVYMFYFLILTAYVLRNIGNFIGSVVLPQTPLVVNMAVILIPAIYGCFLGIEVIGRTGEILFPWAMSVFIITALLLIPKMHPGELFPMFPEGITPSIKAGYPLVGFPSLEIAICLMLIPFVQNQQKIKKYFYITSVGTLISGTLLSLITIMVLGVDLTARSPYAVYDVAREIRIERVMERAEVIVGIIWLITSFMKLLICFYVTVIVTVQCFNVISYKNLVIPFSFLLLPLSLWVLRNTAELEWSGIVYPMMAVFPGFVIPAVLLIVGNFRSRNKQGSEAQTQPPSKPQSEAHLQPQPQPE
ncbi:MULTISPECIES: GerAB/ArcD/ProY family transporter [Paenibacillus]|uniref:GerAB/ArcD/ProY family transporter n=1 Tax=Paenibacillus TaxID=44249 RepID=UPI0011A9FBF1|nr:MULTISPECIES: endospore germination permease [Paenibacillus]GIO60942.1 germination protein [Paenibacillus cineris]